MLDRRIAIVSTWWFIRHGDTADTFRLAKVLRTDPERLMQRAVGWMLREAGKRNPLALKRFLARHQRQMPRLMLRSAIERLPEAERRSYLR
jgi:3-methyladenine DNA glycosylase AlkD